MCLDPDAGSQKCVHLGISLTLCMGAACLGAYLYVHYASLQRLVCESRLPQDGWGSYVRGPSRLTSWPSLPSVVSAAAAAALSPAAPTAAAAESLPSAAGRPVSR